MASRLKLHDELKALIENDNVYFQPPASVMLSYPCVIYSIGSGNAKRADDMVYNFVNRYELTFIYKTPNVDIIERVIGSFPMCTIDRVYCADNLNHYVFTLYY